MTRLFCDLFFMVGSAGRAGSTPYPDTRGCVPFMCEVGHGALGGIRMTCVKR